MKKIAFVADIHAESAGGEPFYRVPNSDRVTTVDSVSVQGKDGEVVEQKLKPHLLRQITFLFERVADAKFVDEKMDAIEADLLRADVRGIIKRQQAEAEKRGYWELADDVWVKLLASTMKPASPPPPGFGFNYIPFVKAVRDAQTPVESEIELPPVAAVAAA